MYLKTAFNYISKKYSGALLLLVLVAFIGIGCAKIVAPTGGPKDVVPPKLLKSTPANRTLNFKGNRIVLVFNKFVNLKDLDKYLLVSPPFSEPPEVKVKGKEILIKFSDTLKPDATYNFYLGNAIVDITEGNALKNFNFAFSTGSVIDSLSLSGKVYVAKTQEGAKDVFVFLYSTFSDSTPYKQKPLYVCRTNEFGRFRFSNLANKSYHLLALKDMNGDLLYNPKAEDIAFADSIVWPKYTPEPVEKIDTLVEKKPVKEKKESKAVVAAQQTDSAKIDTGPPPDFTLQLFNEPDSAQRITKTIISAPNQLVFYFKYPASDVRIQSLDARKEIRLFREFTRNRDTLTSWILPPLPDSVKVVVSSKGVVLDSIIRPLPKLKEKSKKEPALKAFSLSANLSQGSYLETRQSLVMISSIPLNSFENKRVKLIISKIKNKKQRDTIVPDLSFADSIHRKIKIDYKWTVEDEYKLMLPSGMIKDMLSRPNDTTIFNFKLRPEEDYGNVILDFRRKNEISPLIIQLLTDKGNLVRQKIVTTEKKVTFDYLLPGKYKVMAIYDRNSNGRWDTGIFLKKQQPEKVVLFSKQFDVRGKWDIEESWDL